MKAIRRKSMIIKDYLYCEINNYLIFSKLLILLQKKNRKTNVDYFLMEIA